MCIRQLGPEQAERIALHGQCASVVAAQADDVAFSQNQEAGTISIRIPQRNLGQPASTFLQRAESAFPGCEPARELGDDGSHWIVIRPASEETKRDRQMNEVSGGLISGRISDGSPTYEEGTWSPRIDETRFQ
ncbi:hypothetical protein [Brevibacterium moorei]|uniref:hypothetical protein n=1 Tax=Brevibacterium moorei TaxID=2968457 RepID=UPI00211C3D1C|nr:hypothetical protein [Brevibacterium sp. 68QC2CO]MCQ9386995.1 hypothetical protein [Brevibacterium sp. 68QC2CO]